MVTLICGHFKAMTAHVGPPTKSGERLMFLSLHARQRLRKARDVSHQRIRHRLQRRMWLTGDC